VGAENTVKDYALIDKVNKGDSMDCAITMMNAEEVDVINRLQAKKTRKMMQYLAVFFAGDIRQPEAFKMQNVVNQKLEDLFNSIRNIGTRRFDIKTTVLS
jgi:hypothetical protein